MATTVLGLVGVFFFDIGTQTQLPPTPPVNLNLQKSEGKWYLSGLATNSKWFEMNKPLVKMSVTFLMPTTAGDLNLNSSFILSEDLTHMTCAKMYYLLKKTATPGKFTFYSSFFQTMNELNVLDVKYDEYMIAQNKRTKNENVIIIHNLYTRKPEVSQAVKDKFIQSSLKQLISPENIVFLPKQGECY